MQHPTPSLHQRAWDTAHRVAEMLYTRFGASQVAVFGSLTEPNTFSKNSDIDIAVWGLPPDTYFRAVWNAEEISGLFKIDIVDFERSKGLFRERIQAQLIPIEKGERYTVDRSTLLQRIADERDKIDTTLQEIRARLVKIQTAPTEYTEEIQIAIAKNLVDCYSGLENIFRRIARDVDLRLPDGSMWHKELLTQMATPHLERPPVISQETFTYLQELLQFRHLFSNIYGAELIYEKTEKHAEQIAERYRKLSDELDTLTNFLATN